MYWKSWMDNSKSRDNRNVMDISVRNNRDANNDRDASNNRDSLNSWKLIHIWYTSNRIAGVQYKQVCQQQQEHRQHQGKQQKQGY